MEVMGTYFEDLMVVSAQAGSACRSSDPESGVRVAVDPEAGTYRARPAEVPGPLDRFVDRSGAVLWALPDDRGYLSVAEDGHPDSPCVRRRWGMALALEHGHRDAVTVGESLDLGDYRVLLYDCLGQI